MSERVGLGNVRTLGKSAKQHHNTINTLYGILCAVGTGGTTCLFLERLSNPRGSTFHHSQQEGLTTRVCSQPNLGRGRRGKKERRREGGRGWADGLGLFIRSPEKGVKAFRSVCVRMSSILRSGGRGGAGNFVSQKDIEAAEKARRDNVSRLFFFLLFFFFF